MNSKGLTIREFLLIKLENSFGKMRAHASIRGHFDFFIIMYASYIQRYMFDTYADLWSMRGLYTLLSRGYAQKYSSMYILCYIAMNSSFVFYGQVVFLSLVVLCTTFISMSFCPFLFIFFNKPFLTIRKMAHW